jgi:type IV pilus assembly protein PilC
LTSIFHYTARSEAGIAVAGAMAASSHQEAFARLRARRLFVTSIDAAGSLRGALAAIGAQSRSRRAARATFVRTLAVLVSSGTPLLRALATAAEQCRDARFAETLRAVSADVSGGCALSDALARRPSDFPSNIVAMVRAGELGGILDDVLERSASVLERVDAVRRQVVSALAYPAFVLTSAACLVGFMLVVTVPGFAGILAELHADVPLPTRILLSLSELVRNPMSWLGVAPALGGGIAAGALFARDARVRQWVDHIALKAPVIGDIRRGSCIASFARTVGTLVECGVILTAAVETSAGVVHSAAFRNAIGGISDALNEGAPLSVALAHSGISWGLCEQMAAVGEQSGTLDTVLVRVAEHYEADLEIMVRGITSILEPALIVALGLVVGGLVASILVPLYAAIGNVH